MENNLDVLDGIMEVDELNIYCHFTDKDPEQIMAQGLKAVESDWHSTLLKLTNEERANLEEFIKRERSISSTLNFRDYVLLLAVPEEDNNTFIEKSDDPDMPYIINSEYIVGSINTANLKTILNESALAWDYVLYR